MRKPTLSAPIFGRTKFPIVAVAMVVALLAGPAAGHARGREGTSASGHTPAAAPSPLGVPGHWRLVFSTNFNTAALDPQVWRTGWFGSTKISGPINVHELACYSPRNVALTGATLNLKITKVPSTCSGVRRPYTGAIVSTNPYDGRSSGGFTYTYGVAEARIYVPGIRGVLADWPAFGAFGQHWPITGEDDILEGISGSGCSRFHSQVNPYEGVGGCDPGVTPGWHTISADWKPNSITWYYDGIEIYHETQGVTSAPMYLVFVNTVSSKWPQLAESDVMKVSYVRVWQPASKSANSVYKYSF